MNFEKIVFPKTENKERSIVEDISRGLINQVENKKESLGEGRTARALMAESHDSFCLKSVFDKELPLNNVYEEMSLMEDVAKLGVRVPKPICAISTTENDYLLMERIKGLSLDDILIRNQSDKLPDNFGITELRAFFSKLKGMVNQMNSNGYFHMDLHPGNIMIDQEGNPVIIDLGDSKKQLISSDNPYRVTSSTGGETILPTDLNKVQEALIALQDYLKNIGYFSNLQKKE